MLAQFLRHKEYKLFYSQCCKKGNTVILDNGAYEDASITGPKYITLIQALKPTYYVLPDEIGDFQMSGMMSMDFIQLTKNMPIPGKKMWVVQAKDGNLDDFVKSYLMAKTWAQGICFPRAPMDYGLPGVKYGDPLRRYKFIQYLQEKGLWSENHYHHMLGMLGGNLLELPYLSSAGINSIDSSAPVWRGLMGFQLEDGKQWPDHKFQVNYTGPISNAPIDGDDDHVGSGIIWAQNNLNKVFTSCQHKG